SGRASSPDSHCWYEAELQTRKFQDPDCPDDERAMILEIRSTGTQTLVEPSIHPSGEQYKWKAGLQPTKVDGKTLERSCCELAACALLARHWRYGRRHEIALAFAGAALRSGWQQSRVEEYIRLAAMAAHDDEIEDRVKTVATTVKRLAAGQKAKGLPTLAE